MTVTERWTKHQGCRTADDIMASMDHVPCALLHGDDRWVVYGRDPVLVVEDPGLKIDMERLGTPPPFFPDLIGWISYEFGMKMDAAFPEPRDGGGPGCRLVMFRTTEVVDRRNRITYRGERQLPSLDLQCAVSESPFAASRQGDSETRDSYMEKVSEIRREIGTGNVYQANLTRTETWSFSGDDRQFARRLARANPAPFSATIRMPGTVIISSSPERFLRLTGNTLFTAPIKGTTGRGDTDAEDQRLGRFLIGDPKNRSELAMITDLLRNDLARVCLSGSVRVEGYPVLETYANVHHLVSRISGTIRPGSNLSDILAASFPGGSITGCPRIAAVNLLHRLETVPRGIYTGSIGWVQADGRAFDLNIAIRTCTLMEDSLSFGVGGGIVWDSDPAMEYDETEIKGRSIVQCLN